MTKLTSSTETEIRFVLAHARKAARDHGASDADADDVAQEATIRILESWSKDTTSVARAAGGRRWQAFISFTARNVHTDHVRSEQRRRHRETTAAGASLALPPRPGSQHAIATDASGIERLFARREIERAIERLPPQQQLCAKFRLLEGFSTSETSVVMGISPSTVSHHLTEAKKKLRDQLTPG